MVGGRGEKVTPLPSLPGIWVVLVVPEMPVKAGKTARMYAELKPAHYTDGTITDKLAKTLHKGGKFSPSMLFNTFENIAFEDSTLRTYREHLVKLGASNVHLAGSGPTLFSMLNNKDEAEDLYSTCMGQGMRVYLAATI